jgi:hypothetical protein
MEIAGDPVPDGQVTPCKDDKLAIIGAKFWCRRVAHEVARLRPETQREAAERFVLRHRLTVLAAFHRRLARADVVKAMGRMFADVPSSDRDLDPQVSDRQS